MKKTCTTPSSKTTNKPNPPASKFRPFPLTVVTVGAGPAGDTGPTVAGGDVWVNEAVGSALNVATELELVFAPDTDAVDDEDAPDPDPEADALALTSVTGFTIAEIATVTSTVVAAPAAVPSSAMSSHCPSGPEMEHSAKTTRLAEGRSTVSRSSVESSTRVTLSD